jgi:hypothetical protein
LFLGRNFYLLLLRYHGSVLPSPVLNYPTASPRVVGTPLLNLCRRGSITQAVQLGHHQLCFLKHVAALRGLLE